jgi:hypothetical protein
MHSEWRSFGPASAEFAEPLEGMRHPAGQDANASLLFVVPRGRKVVPVKEAARLMRKTEAEVGWLAEMRLLYARRESGELKVEPAIVN